MGEQHGARSGGDELVARLREALAAGTRDAFADLLTDDVHWGGEHGANECSNKDEAGAFYEGLLASGIRLEVTRPPRPVTRGWCSWRSAHLTPMISRRS